MPTLNRLGWFMATSLGMGLAGMSEMFQASRSRVRHRHRCRGCMATEHGVDGKGIVEGAELRAEDQAQGQECNCAQVFMPLKIAVTGQHRGLVRSLILSGPPKLPSFRARLT